MIRVTENLTAVRRQLESAAESASRQPETVTLVAVSKRHPASAIAAAASAGQVHFGENYVSEGVAKIRELGRSGFVWHYIGAIQSNKTRDIAAHFDWVHTIDRLKIAARLSAQRPADQAPLNVCIQVNIDNEPQKAGVSLEAIGPLAGEIDALPHLRLRGLMCLPAAHADTARTRTAFARMREAMITIQHDFSSVDTLSMGMSGDMDLAIREGSTMIRVGTAIFGPRDSVEPGGGVP
ncbi:MAG: YggS family pyridoxal phosphate-dependent enzyme [Pseudomonadota bacterium]